MNMYNKIVENGVNVDALMGAREAITAAPEAAKFQWRASSRWVNGTHTRAEVERFSGFGEEHSHKRCFSFDMDHPELFAAQDNGATPLEFVLVGLAGCLTAGIASVAQNRNIQLHSVKATLTGNMDIQGILGMDSAVRNGYEAIRVVFDIDADASPEDIEALVAQSQKRSAVYDMVANPTNIIVETRA